MLHLEDVFLVFDQGTPLEKIALKNICLNVNKGDIVSVIGCSGSGKTSLLKLLAGHVTTTFGKIFLNKIDITSQSLSEKTKNFASVLNDKGFDIIYNMTIAENLMLAKMHHKNPHFFSPALKKETIDEFYEFLSALDFFKIQHLMNIKINSLPKAYLKVIALCMAALQKPQILLIDEHLHGIDNDIAEILLEVTKKIITINELTTIITIDDPKMALSFGNRTIVLRHGHVHLDLSDDERKNIKLDNIFDPNFEVKHNKEKEPFHFIPDTLHPISQEEITDEEVQQINAENTLNDFQNRIIDNDMIK